MRRGRNLLGSHGGREAGGGIIDGRNAGGVFLPGEQERRHRIIPRNDV